MRRDDEIALTPKAYDTLLELLRSNGRVVERDELMRRVWPDSFVEEGNLKVTIFNLRRALEDNPSEPKYIQTVSRHGYRFIAEVVESEDTEQTERIGPATHVDYKVRSIAVMPFKTLGVDEEYLGFGLADAVIIKLSGLSEVVVRPTSAVRRYIGSDEPAQEVARQLGVESVLEGNIYRAGDRVRVTAQLVTVTDETPLWAGKFDERFTDIFDVEDSISEQVAQALMLKLSGQDRRQLTRRYTENIEAYQLYLRGRYHWAKRLATATRIASEQFRAAIDLDPNYTLAYAGLADCYAQLAWLTLMSPAEALPVAKAAAERALDLDPLLAEAHTSLAWIHLIYDLDYAASEVAFRRSLELNPNYSVARMWFGVLHIAAGRFSEALHELSTALVLDPLSPIINALVGWPYYFTREYERAISLFQKALQLGPRSLPAHYLLGSTYLQLGRGDEARAQMELARELDESALTVIGLAQAHAISGERTKAEQLIVDLQSRGADKRTYVSPYDEASLHLRLGDHDRALTLLEKSLEDRSTWRIFLPVDPKFDALRNDGRFAALLKRMETKA